MWWFGMTSKIVSATDLCFKQAVLPAGKIPDFLGDLSGFECERSVSGWLSVQGLAISFWRDVHSCLLPGLLPDKNTGWKLLFRSCSFDGSRTDSSDYPVFFCCWFLSCKVTSYFSLIRPLQTLLWRSSTRVLRWWVPQRCYPTWYMIFIFWKHSFLPSL